MSKLTGFKIYRHGKNPIEKKLHDKFNEMHINDRNCNVDLLVFPPFDTYQNHSVDTLSDREKQIMLTTVQWLGSSVGQYFLSECGFKLEKM